MVQRASLALLLARPPLRTARILFCLATVAFLGATPAAAQSDGPAVEACIGCHSRGQAAPVGDIRNVMDLHFTDLHPDGPATPSGYRRLDVAITSVDVTGTSTIVEFSAVDQSGAAVTNLFASDGRLVLARLVDGVDPMNPDTLGDPIEWQRLVQERFTSGGLFQYLGAGAYRFTALFDPTTVPIAAGDTLRAALQISAGDIPAANPWCDFDADLAAANDCVSPTSLTRDIIRTDTCNGCHGATSDTKLSFHGGGRTEVEYCVTCHNRDRNPETAFTTLIHKIHYGSQLTMDYLDGEYAHVNFIRDIDNCAGACHQPGPIDVDNWKMQPTREACGSCHDDVNFDTGANHGQGGQQLTNRLCRNCHPPEGPVGFNLPVATVHQGVPLEVEAALYRGAGNGFALETVSLDPVAESLTVEYSVTRNGVKMDLASDPKWVNGGSLNLDLAWSPQNYTNEGSGSNPAPAQPVRFSARDIGNTVTDLGNGSYRRVIDVSGFGFGSLTVGLEGHPNADLIGTGSFSSVPVRSAYQTISLEPRTPVENRRNVIDMAKCNGCHDSGGAGLSLHGANRTGEMQVCVLCHNPNATDLQRRPANPGQTPDGKREEAIDMKRLIHQIHMGEELVDPVVVYGFGGSVHDYATVRFIGNASNCLTCHNPGTYGAEDAWTTLPTTIDTGADVLDPADDLNISPVTAVCASCHDTERAKEHMVANGGTFRSFDEEILVPEPGKVALALAALGGVGLLSRRRWSDLGRS
jgi:OmcA/MtrC family decaheme c-type cytochrome